MKSSMDLTFVVTLLLHWCNDFNGSNFLDHIDKASEIIVSGKHSSRGPSVEVIHGLIERDDDIARTPRPARDQAQLEDRT